MFEIKWDRASFKHREIERFAQRRDAYMLDANVGMRTLKKSEVIVSEDYKIPFGVEMWLKVRGINISLGFDYVFSKPSRHYWDFNVLVSTVEKA